MREYAVVRINAQACYIKSIPLRQNLALVAYSPDNKQWVADILYPCLSDKALMTIAKFVYKQNKATNPEYSLAV
jgi:hypothetical protein